MTTSEPKLKSGNTVKGFFGKLVSNQLFIPLAALLLLVLFNLIADPSFFKNLIKGCKEGAIQIN